jgi:hypothetical protein
MSLATLSSQAVFADESPMKLSGNLDSGVEHISNNALSWNIGFGRSITAGMLSRKLDAVAADVKSKAVHVTGSYKVTPSTCCRSGSGGYGGGYTL